MNTEEIVASIENAIFNGKLASKTGNIIITRLRYLEAKHLAAETVADLASRIQKRGHPVDGSCMTDHYIDRECDCGIDALGSAITNYRKTGEPK